MTTPEQEIYIPKGTPYLDELPQTQIRLGIQGYPGIGKTWSALTANNPLIANSDNKLTAHKNKHIPVIPFNSPAYVNEVLKIPNTSDGRINSNHLPATHEALLWWLRNEGHKLTPNQTLIIDSLTSFINSLETYWRNNPEFTKGGKENDYAPFTAKIAYGQEMTSLLKGLRCNVIMTCHETVERNKDKELTGRVKPLMSGQYSDQLAAQFTDWFRMHHVPKRRANGEQIVLNKGTKYEYPIQNEEGEYFWQTKTDELCVCCCSMPEVPMMVKANFVDVFFNRKWI